MKKISILIIVCFFALITIANPTSPDGTRENPYIAIQGLEYEVFSPYSGGYNLNGRILKGPEDAVIRLDSQNSYIRAFAEELELVEYSYELYGDPFLSKETTYFVLIVTEVFTFPEKGGCTIFR